MSVEFEPVPLAPRRRRMDPVSIGAVAIALALAVSVAKPWGEASTPGTAEVASVAPSTPSASPRATASPALPRILTARVASSPTWAEVTPVLRRHEAWGVRAIVVNAQSDVAAVDGPQYAERWFRFPAGATTTATAQVDPGDQSIVALGVTFPTAHTPLDARVWRVGSNGLEWIDTAALDPVPSGGAFLYVRSGVVVGPSRAWTAGTYRIDVLVDGSVRRFGVTIPDRFSNVPDPSQIPVAPRELVDLAGASLPDVPAGLFAMVDGVAVPMAADEGTPLDEAAAWLDVDAGTGRAPRSFVAPAYLPKATSLGVMLPPRATLMSATIARLAPEPLPMVPSLVDHTPRDGTPSTHVLFRAPGGRAWTPGVYRLSVIWADVDGLHEGSWHAELRPGPVRELPRLLAAARSWARYAGATGVILGTAEPLEGGPRSVAIRLLRLSAQADPTYPVPTGVGCGGALIDGRPGVLGFAYPADRYLSTASATLLFPFLRDQDLPVMTAAFGVPGLILVAPARSPELATASYRFTVGDADDARNYSICLGATESND